MADSFHPLHLGTIIRFGSLEFNSLGSRYDMVLLPSRNDTKDEPLPPSPGHERCSGHHSGHARRARQRQGSSDPTARSRNPSTCPANPPWLTINTLGFQQTSGKPLEASSSTTGPRRDPLCPSGPPQSVISTPNLPHLGKGSPGASSLRYRAPQPPHLGLNPMLGGKRPHHPHSHTD